jgi:hypothetical protein
VREVRNKEAALCPDGTRHRCPLGSITSFASLEATVTQRLRILDLSLLVRGLPLNKKPRQNTLQSGPDGHGTSGRAACRTAGERACVAPGTLAADAHWTLVGWLGASAARMATVSTAAILRSTRTKGGSAISGYFASLAAETINRAQFGRLKMPRPATISNAARRLILHRLYQQALGSLESGTHTERHRLKPT